MGDSFEQEAVHALASGMTRSELRRACESLATRDLLVPSNIGSFDESLRFRHGLLREAAYASLAKSARARLYERHATWLTGWAASCRRPMHRSDSISKPPAGMRRR